MRWHFVSCFSAIFLTLLLRGVRADASVTYGFVDEAVVASGLRFPIDFCFLKTQGGSRLVIVQKDGLVRLAVNGVLQNAPFLDLRENTASFFDRGMLSCTVDTAFQSGKPYIYFAYAYHDDSMGEEGDVTARVSRFNVNGGLTAAIPSSEHVLVGSVVEKKCRTTNLRNRDIVCCWGPGHCLGGMAMDKAGNLFIAVGDGAASNQPGELTLLAQDINSLLGKVLKVNRNGQAVGGNPWYKNGRGADENASKIWAMGLRQPFRMSMDPIRQLPLVAEVGWSQYEEINWGVKKANYGWPCKQGKNEVVPAFSSFRDCVNYPLFGTPTNPAEFYGRTVGQAVTAVHRVNFSSWPAQFRNRIFYVDYVVGWMKFFEVNPSSYKKVGPSVNFASGLSAPVQIRPGPGDALYYIAIGAQELRRIRYSPDNTPPRVVQVNPPNRAKNVEITTSVVVFFSKPIKPSTASTRNVDFVRIMNDGSRRPVAYKKSYEEGIHRLTIQPEGTLKEFSQYSLKINNIEDPDGRKMAVARAITFSTGAGYTLFTSDLRFILSKNGLGPVERDEANGGQASGDGARISIRGEEHEKGIGVVPFSRVRVRVPDPLCTRFQATVGVDDSAVNLDGGRLFFKVKTDSGVAFDSRDKRPLPLTRTTPAMEVEANIRGTTFVDLIVEDGGWASRPLQNLGSWGSARFRCGAFDGVSPKVLQFRPQDGAKNVPVDNPDLTLTFNEPVDQSSILDGVRLTLRGVEISWSPRFNENTTVVRLKPSRQLEYDSKYSLVVTQKVRDLAGNRLRSEYSSTFNTREAPATGSVVLVSELTPISLKGSRSFFDDSSRVKVLNGLQPRSFRKGFGMESYASVKLRVPQSCFRVRGLVGATTQSSESTAKCVFEITEGSRAAVKFSQRVAPGRPAVALNFEVSPGNTLLLRARTPPSGNNSICLAAALRYDCRSGARTRFLSETTLQGTVGRVSVNKQFNGNAIRVLVASTRTLKSGLRMRAHTKATYNIPGRCSQFLTTVGVDATKFGSSTKARVIAGDDVRATPNCASGLLTPDSGAKSIACDLGRSASEFSISVVKVDRTNAEDFVAAGNARFNCAADTRAPKCRITSVTNNFVIGDTIRWSAKAVDFLGNELRPSALSFRLLLLHCGTDCHEHEAKTIEGRAQGSFKVEDHGDEFNFKILCTACHAGQCGTSSANSSPKVARITATSQPTGLVVGVDSGNGPAPFSRRVVVGSTVVVSTVRQQGRFTFSHWAHDRSLTSTKFQHVVRGTAPRTFKAIFKSN